MKLREILYNKNRVHSATFERPCSRAKWVIMIDIKIRRSIKTVWFVALVVRENIEYDAEWYSEPTRSNWIDHFGRHEMCLHRLATVFAGYIASSELSRTAANRCISSFGSIWQLHGALLAVSMLTPVATDDIRRMQSDAYRLSWMSITSVMYLTRRPLNLHQQHAEIVVRKSTSNCWSFLLHI
jgi:hypothetical protein